MYKHILITGATDGIGLSTAKVMVALGHQVSIHGRNPVKLGKVENELRTMAPKGKIHSYLADLSHMNQVEELARAIKEQHTTLDVLINNAGVYSSPNLSTKDGLDIRFVVNTLAPYLLSQKLLPIMGKAGRIVNVSSAAQAAVNIEALKGHKGLSDGLAYAQSKLALTMWSRNMAQSLPQGPIVVAVNPGSMLGTNMVKEAYGVSGADIRIGSDILRRAALSDEFADASGTYFDNDTGRFAPPHPDALDSEKVAAVVNEMEQILNQLT